MGTDIFPKQNEDSEIGFCGELKSFIRLLSILTVDFGVVVVNVVVAAMLVVTGHIIFCGQ